jgi:hypothetical protein
MTLHQAKAVLRPLGLWITKHRDEYRVAFPNDEESAYYTNDLDDAVGTGIEMARTK